MTTASTSATDSSLSLRLERARLEARARRMRAAVRSLQARERDDSVSFGRAPRRHAMDGLTRELRAADRRLRAMPGSDD